MSDPKSLAEFPGSPAHDAGVGIWIAQLFDEEAPERRGALVILDVLPGGAGERGRLKGGDRITHVGNKPVAGMTLEEVVMQHLRGAVGSEVKLQVLRGIGSASVDVRLVREMPAPK
jgi:C-terminal processing protease CtpA/Prc